jgi:hypothetical protein
MTRIRATKRNKGLEKVLLTIGILLVVVSIIMFIIDVVLNSNADLKPLNYILLFIQGVLLIVLASFNTRYRKYYIEWDDDIIEYFLPKVKHPVRIEISDIKNIDIKLFEIHLTVGEDVRIMDLGHVDFEEIKSIKTKFEEIKSRIK